MSTKSSTVKYQHLRNFDVSRGNRSAPRLLLLNYEFPPLGGGASQATYCMVRELRQQGYSVDVLTASANGRRYVESLDGARIYRVRSWRRGIHDAGLWGVASYLWFAYLELRRLMRTTEYDLAHFYFALPTGILALYWRNRTRKPYVVSLRGSDVPGYDSENLMLQILHRILRPNSRKILGRAAHVVANSRSLCTLALRSYPDLPISVITNGIDTTSYFPGKKRIFGDQRVRALSVARLVKRKGLKTMLRAMARVRAAQATLDVAGDGPLLDELKQLAVELGMESKVKFLGALGRDELKRAYQRADFFILPSLSESFSMSLLEAMASGLPVIASNVGGIPELVNPDENGILVAPGDAEALSTAVERMARSPRLRKIYGDNNRAKVEAQYSWAAITSQYITQCYLDCATARAPNVVALPRN